jgi:serine/threonine-protein kinase SRPK3
VVDFGNGCWVHKHYTDDIQTRQYRCPEVIIGVEWSTPVDMWSMACMVFEMVTGDLLFDPRSGRNYSRNEDHLAQFVELLGDIPENVALLGTNSTRFFDRRAKLRHIRHLQTWPLQDVLEQKYSMDTVNARELAEFLLPMLHFDPGKRATAEEMLNHPWLV